MAVLLLAAPPVRAGDNKHLLYDGPATWAEFEVDMRKREHADEVVGLSYMVSGGIAMIGGIIGVQSSPDPYSRGFFAISETLGIAALGYGASIYWNGNEYSSFYRAVRDSSLPPAQKTELLRKFLENERAEYQRAEWIRIATYSLLAAVNFYAASQEPNPDVRRLLQFLGGVNLVLAFSCTW